MRTINKRSTTTLPYAAALLAALAMAVTVWATPATAEHHGQQGEGAAYLVGVEGMVCPSGCTESVREALETVDGVEKVDVNFEAKNATVEMAPGKTLTADRCEQAFGNSGYFVSSFDEKKTGAGES